jgi:hypothetical protein
VYTRCAACARAIENNDALIAGLRAAVGDVADVVAAGEGLPGAGGSPAATFAFARVIIGPHGAGLVNMLLLAPPALVVEFQESHAAMPFARMAARLGLDHVMLFPPGATHETPMDVDVQEAVTVVAEWVRRALRWPRRNESAT